MAITFIRTLATVGDSQASAVLSAAVPAGDRIILIAAQDEDVGLSNVPGMFDPALRPYDTGGNSYAADGTSGATSPVSAITPPEYAYIYSAHVVTPLAPGAQLTFPAALGVRVWTALQFRGIRPSDWAADPGGGGYIDQRTGRASANDLVAPFGTVESPADFGLYTHRGRRLLVAGTTIEGFRVPDPTWTISDPAWLSPWVDQEATDSWWYGLQSAYRFVTNLGPHHYHTSFADALEDGSDFFRRFMWGTALVAYLGTESAGVANLHTEKAEYVAAFPDEEDLAVRRAAFSTPPFETSAALAGAANPCLTQDPVTERLFVVYELDGEIRQQHSDDDGETWRGEVTVFTGGSVPRMDISDDRYALRAAFVETDSATGRGVITAVAQEPGDATWGDEFNFADAGSGGETDLEWEPEGFDFSFAGDTPGRLLLLAKAAGESEYSNWQSWSDGRTWTRVD